MESLEAVRKKFSVVRRHRQDWQTLLTIRDQIGQSLVEVIVTIAIAVLITSGLVSVVVVAVRNSQFTKNQALATKYASEGMEKVRAYRDDTGNWTTFTSNCNGYNPSPSPPAPFTRTITCGFDPNNPSDNNRRLITVTVSWSDSSGTHRSNLSSIFSNQSLWK